jgi:uncharacterized protein (DUF2252 family)
MIRLQHSSQQILAQNAGRDVERLLLKLQGMRADAFAFFRGTNPLFLGFLPRADRLFHAPSTLVCGDLHFENFGAFKGDNRLCYFDINDFDEACVAPFTIDVVRFLACIDIAADGLLISPGQVRDLEHGFLDAYVASVADGKPRWIERSLATGIFRDLLRRAIRRTRPALLDRFSRERDGERRIRIDGRRTLALREGEAKRLRKFMKEFRHGQSHKRAFFRLLDASRRIAGNGSLGLPRYVLLIEGRGSPDANYALDLKYAAPSAVAAWLGGPQPKFASESERVVRIQRIMQAIPPAMLRAETFDDAPFILKELQPSVDRLDFSEWRGKPRRIREAVVSMGHTTAWAHLRGCGHFGTTNVEALQTYVVEARWRHAARKLAAAAAAKMRTAWKQYCKDYDAGAVVGTIEPG